jgi:hydroxybutyrate-dimer hydrolase
MTSSAIGLWESIVVNYGNSYLRSSADAPLCNVSYAFTDQSGKPIATPSPVIKTLFGASSGIVPTGGLQLINDLAKDGAASFYFSKNDQGLFDYGFDNLLCFSKAFSTAPFQTQVNALAFSGNLHKTPTLIVQGGADNLIQPSQHSRPYLALNYQKEGGESNVRYLEVSHAQHFDSFLNYPAMRSYYIPLHYYFEQALDAMFNHLNTGAPLPPSQLIHTQPNIDITQALIKLPSIAANDETLKNTASYNRIRVDQDGVTIPSN